MQIGDQDLGLSIVILFGLLFVALIGNIFFFARGHESYSVKYQIFMKSGFFRRHPSLCQTVQVIYHIFFAVPFVLLLIIAILRAVVNATEFLTIILNGLIVLLTIYPIKHLWFYKSKLVIWLLVIASQLNTLYQQMGNSYADTYTILSSIFYPINCILFSLAILAHEQDFWELDQAIELCQDELRAIYPQFIKLKEEEIQPEVPKEEKYEVEDSKIEEGSKINKKTVKQYNIPDIFDGGIYGSLCRYRGNRGKKRAVIYGLSLAILCLNAYLVWLGGSSLGVIGLITNFVYDIFIFAFSALNTPERSVRNIFLLIFLGRLMSFIFGQELWIFGYCVLYLIVGIFVGRIIINSRFPLKKVKKSKKERHKHQQKNALKTPEFVLFILTTEIFLLVLAASLGVGNANISYSYSSSISVPLWQFALIAVILTWIIIIFMASYRLYQRQCNNIKETVEYYFGSAKVRTFHIAMTFTYLLVVGLGLYCYYILKESTAFLSCLFLPLIALALIKLEHEWVKNQYQILADIPQHNERVQKAKNVIMKKKIALSKQKNNKQPMINQTIIVKGSKVEINNNNFQSSKTMLLAQQSKMLNGERAQEFSETSTQMEQNHAIKEELKQLGKENEELVELEYNWRTFQGKIGPYQLFRDFLTPSDQWILIMILVLFLLFTAYVVATYMVASTIFGMLIVLCLVSLLSLSPFYRYTRTFKDLQWPQYLWYYFGILLGIIYWCFYRKETALVMIWSGWYILCLGALIVIGLFRNIHKNYIYLLIGNLAATIVFICILLYMTVSVIPATLVTLILGMLAIGAIPVAYNTLEGQTPLAVKLICGGVILAGIIGVAVAGWATNYATNLAVFSFVMGAIYIVLFLTASIMFYSRQENKYQSPHVYSGYGKPIYKFQSRAEQLKSSIRHKLLYQITGIVLVVYSAVVTIIFQSKQYAVYALGYFCCLAFLQEFLFAIKTHEQLASQRSKITKELLAKTLKELHSKYMVDFHTNTFSKVVEQQKYELKEKAEKAGEADLDKAYRDLACKHEEYVKNEEQQQKFLFFWTALIQFQLFTDQKSQMVQLLNQLKQIETILMQYGIFLQSINYNIPDFVTKYQLVTQEIEELDPFDFLNYQKILEEHQRLRTERNQQQQKLAEAIEQEQKQKEIVMFEKMKKEMQKSSNQQINQFEDLIKGLKSKNKFQDLEFKVDDALGGTLDSLVDKWRRPKKGEVLVKDGFSAYDIKQGAIGDCYLISSMGVLGEKWIKAALGGCRPQNEELLSTEWRNQKGAYMIKFNKFLKDVYITIDDQLPVDSHDNFVFAQSEDPEEIWPAILEKAYAKLYGGYNNIISGKAHRVLAEFTGGFPSELATLDYKDNPNSLWQRILTARENQYLMAAGSPSHADGDKAYSARGIVQGHAYAVLDAKQVQTHKLMKLKNPHGTGGVEWSGDFSDSSPLMNARLMQLLQHENKEDGIFWMSFEDFLHQFKSLYLCALFDKEKWLQWPTIQGKFTEQNSFGVPNLSDETYKNPQYGITVTKKCTLFVNMMQQAENSLEGQNNIYLRIQKNEGKRISKHNMSADLQCGKKLRPSNLINISNEAVLQADSYPYTFTIYLSTLEEGDQGDYKLQIYCSDKAMTVIPDEQFDRELFQSK